MPLLELAAASLIAIASRGLSTDEDSNSAAQKQRKQAASKAAAPGGQSHLKELDDAAAWVVVSNSKTGTMNGHADPQEAEDLENWEVVCVLEESTEK
mmetsp:Transcript_17517/g.40790  ORF Transcript_17517/g.40790 Transcript_17517/m.40790 type:complete len:97 (+) Transcript_17517:116-406(+)